MRTLQTSKREMSQRCLLLTHVSKKQYLGQKTTLRGEKPSLIVFPCSQAGALLALMWSHSPWYSKVNAMRWIYPLYTALLHWALNLPGRENTNSGFAHVLQTVD